MCFEQSERTRREAVRAERNHMLQPRDGNTQEIWTKFSQADTPRYCPTIFIARVRLVWCKFGRLNIKLKLICIQLRLRTQIWVDADTEG